MTAIEDQFDLSANIRVHAGNVAKDCAHCGRCPHCGRGPNWYETWRQPYYVPYTPYPTWPFNGPTWTVQNVPCHTATAVTLN